MTDGAFTTHIDVSSLTSAQRHQLDGRLRDEGIQVAWAGDRLQFDQAFEARIESLVAELRSSGGPASTPSAPPFPPTAANTSTGVGYQPAGYGAPAPYGTPMYGFYQPPVTNSNAVISLVLALASFLVCPICFVPAIILGRKAEREIEESGGRQTGEGLAKAGWIIGAIYGGLVGLFVLFFIVIFIAAAVSSA